MNLALTPPVACSFISLFSLGFLWDIRTKKGKDFLSVLMMERMPDYLLSKYSRGNSRINMTGGSMKGEQ